LELAEGQIITADFLSGAARVKKFEKRENFSLLEVVLENTGKFRSLRLISDQLKQIEIVHRDAVTVSDNPESFFLFIEATRIRLAHQFDPQLAVGVSQIEPLPHQLEAVYEYALKSPRLRFLIADDPGAGKTIMAGLILKEMQYRGLVERALIVAPGHLRYQWQREMKERFGVRLRLIDRNTMHSVWGENVWEEYPLAIASIDFLKQDDIRATLSGTRWDLIIVDEAHKMSAYAYRSKKVTKIKPTKRYKVGEILSRQAEHLLFLTATPHRGDEDNFRLFLDLLRPGFFAKPDSLKESVQRQDNPLLIRRLKEQMKKFDGSPIFPPRHIQTVRFRMTDQEIGLYNNVTSYVRNYFDQARENRQIAFAMMILQQRLTSSIYAILSSLQHRKEKLQEFLKLPDKIRSDDYYRQVKLLNDAELEDLPEEERWDIEKRMEQVTIAENIDDVKLEIKQLDKLIEQAKGVRSQEIESKLVKLRDEILESLRGRKLLIFTKQKATLQYLVEKLQGWGYRVNHIHGRMNIDARVEAEHVFRHETQIMVATEAAGEGINLQFCSLMVNYDIPWNPNRLEQRMGRIHRYGQDKEVYIWNMVSKDTREGQILDRLFEKLESIREQLGDDRVFDIIGEIIPGTDFGALLKDAIFNQRRMEEIDAKIDEMDSEHAREIIDRVFMNALATQHIDSIQLQRDQLQSRENRLIPEYVEDFFLRGFEKLGGKYTSITDGYRIDSVPFEMRQLAEDYSFKTKYGKVARGYKKIAFDKQIATMGSDYEFIAPGHPLLESLNEVIFRQLRQDATGHPVFADPDGKREGVLWFVQGAVRDGAGNIAGQRIFCFLQSSEESLQKLNPAVLWDLEPSPNAKIPPELADLIGKRDVVEDYVVSEFLIPYQSEMANRRERDAEIKERYGLQSLDYLIQESNQKLLDYDERQQRGEKMDMPIVREQRNYHQLEQRSEELKREIRLEKNIAVEEPRIIGVAAVVLEPEIAEGTEQVQLQPTEEHGAAMVRDDEIEAIGMRVAGDYEEENGWEVSDVSQEKHGGFDLRSINYNEDGKLEAIRYIEVKARAQTGEIRLSTNEWKKARQLKDEYWLYIVTHAGTENPKLERIQNPASKLQQEKDIYATGYKIPKASWQQLAQQQREASVD